MAESTGIEWCDATFNPWWGCEKVSPGCAHCYADTLAKRYAKGERLWGDGHAFRFFGDAHWDGPLRWARRLPAKLGRRPRVFCASMADVFEERLDLNEHRERLFQLIRDTPELDWLVLTKRPDVARDWLRAHYESLWSLDAQGAQLWQGRDRIPWGVPPNLWMGTSIENARFTWRADVLREIPAAVRFLSCEPLLGSLFIPRDGELPCSCWPSMSTARPVSTDRLCDPWDGGCGGVKTLLLHGIDWCIVGGESGPGARLMRPDWAREIRDACADGGPAFFFKQWGEYVPVIGHLDRDARKFVLTGAGVEPFQSWCHGSTTAWDRPARTARGDLIVERVGKKKAGRELDGRTWDEFPESAARTATS